MERELTEEELLNIYAGPNKKAMEEKTLEHPEMYRNYPPEAVVELLIVSEEAKKPNNMSL